jgi:hypothetical protein
VRGQPAFVLTPEHHRWSVRLLRDRLNSRSSTCAVSGLRVG